MKYKDKSFEELLGKERTAEIYERFDSTVKQGTFLLLDHCLAQPITLKEKREFLDRILRDIKFMQYQFEFLKTCINYDKEIDNA